MEVLVSAQWRSVAFAVLFGVLAGVLYDFLRVLRILCGVRTGEAKIAPLRRPLPFLPADFFERKPAGRGRRIFHVTLVFLCDLLWLPTVGALFSVFVYWQNDGVFRFYMLFAAFLGFLLYIRTVGRLVLHIAERLALLLRILLFYATLLLSLPLRLICAFLRLLARFLGRTVLLPLYSRGRMRMCLKRARRGI